eukprot:12900650-Alexandrium_andersonii.AAC.1
MKSSGRSTSIRRSRWPSKPTNHSVTWGQSRPAPVHGARRATASSKFWELRTRRTRSGTSNQSGRVTAAA